MSPAAVPSNPDGRDSVDCRTPVIAQNSCHPPAAALRPGRIYSQFGLPTVEQKVTLSWENGHRNISFQRQI